MTAWNKLQPTLPQLRAIETYNKAYGIKLNIKTKQDAHNLISIFAQARVLEFNPTVVKRTNISYTVINEELFSKHQTFNHNITKDIVNINVKAGIAYITSKVKKVNPNMLKALNDSLNKDDDTIAMSEHDDSLGYLDEAGLAMEDEYRGNNPMNYKM